MDRARQVLALDLPPGMPNIYAARAEHGQIPLSTLHHRAKGRRSIEEKAQSQQYLTQCEEKALIKFLLQMENLRQPVRVKYIRTLAYRVRFRRSKTDRRREPGSGIPETPSRANSEEIQDSGLEPL